MKYKVELMVDVPNNYKKEFPDLSPQAYIAQELGWLDSSMGVEVTQIRRAMSLEILTEFIEDAYPTIEHPPDECSLCNISSSIFDPYASMNTLLNCLDENDPEWKQKWDCYWR